MHIKLVPISVEAYSGFKAEEVPRCFECEGVHCRISQIRRMWIEESVAEQGRSIHFEVIANKQKYHILYKPKADVWYLAKSL